MWVLKLLKLKKLSKINLKFQNFKSPLPHINGLNVGNVLRKFVVYYTRKHKNVKQYKLVMIWIIIILKNEQGIKTLWKFHIYSKMMKKNMSCTWIIISIYYNKLQKKLFQNSFIWKSFFGKKNLQLFFLIIMLVHYISFTPLFVLF